MFYKGVEMNKKLENLKWSNSFVTHLGCIKSCLDYLDKDVSYTWLYGAMGHAFIINICKNGL